MHADAGLHAGASGCSYRDSKRRATVIAGDAAINVRCNVKQGIPPGFHDDMTQQMQSILRLRVVELSSWGRTTYVGCGC